MYHYEYVTKKEAKPYRELFDEIIRAVQDKVRDKFTFSYEFIGSSKRNMITCDYTTNKGFDFDINLHVNDDEEKYSAEEIKNSIMNAINSVARLKGFNFCENSTRVITLKKIDWFKSRIEFSCDFAIVHDYIDKDGNDRQQYIRHNKERNTYTWEYQSKGFNIEKKIEWMKKNCNWSEVCNEIWGLYLDKKNYNTDKNKHSRSLYAETINEVYKKQCI